MLRHLTLLALLALTGCKPSGYKLGGHFIEKNAILHSESKLALKDAQVSMTTPDATVFGKMDLENNRVTSTRVLTVDQGKATSLETFFEYDMILARPTFQGRSLTSQQANLLHGTTVTSKWVNGRWIQTLKGAQPTPAQSDYLKLSIPEGTPYPDTPLGIGESWSVPQEQLRQYLGDFVDAKAGEMKITPIREADMDGQKCLLLITELRASGTKITIEGKEVKMTMDMQGTVYRSLKDRIDVKCELLGTLKIEQTMQKDGLEFPMTTEGSATLVQTAWIERGESVAATSSNPATTPAKPGSAPSSTTGPDKVSTSATGAALPPATSTAPSAQPSSLNQSALESARLRNGG